MEAAAPARVLIVAYKTAASPPLLDAVRQRAAKGPARFTLVVPAEAHGLQGGDEQAGRLLGDLGPLGEVGEPRAVVGDALGDARLRGGDGVALLAHRAQHPFVHRAVGDVHQRGEVHRSP